jgi:hypothetical protein
VCTVKFFLFGEERLLDFADFLVVVVIRLIVAFLGDPPIGVSKSVTFPVLIGDFAV